jgi:hypothetical protein
MRQVILQKVISDRILCLRRFALLLLCVLSQSCFPMGMPELYSGDEYSRFSRPREDLRPAVLIVLPPIEDPYNVYHHHPVNHFGYQYLMGVFPFTRLYFEHGEKSFATEVALRSFEEQGYRAFTSPESSIDLAMQHLCPSATVRVDVESLRINAYDLFLTRRLSVKGSGRLEVWTRLPSLTNSEGVKKTFYPLNIDSAEFKRFALAPSLAYRAESGLRESIENLVTSERIVRDVVVGNRCRARRVAPDRSVIVVAKPVLEEPAQQSAAILYESYGFRSLPFSASSLARVVQRGAESALIDLKLPSIGASSVSARLPSAGYQFMKIQVSDLSLVDEKLQIQLKMTLSEKGSSLGSNTKLARGVCRIEQSLDSTLDGAPFFSIERGVNEAIQSMLDNKTFKGVSCS